MIEAQTVLETGASDTWKTLIVDDERAVREMIGTILRRRGHEVLLAEDGERGWEIYRREKPDVVISDVMMPVMNGIELLQRIREHDPHAEVVLITGFARTELVVQALRSGADNFVEKPFRTIDLMTHLEESFHRLRLQTENRRLKQLLADNDPHRSTAVTGVEAALGQLETLYSDMTMELTDEQAEKMARIVSTLEAALAGLRGL